MTDELEKLEEEISGALARGFCNEETSGKVVDATLIKAQTKEVMLVIKTLRSKTRKEDALLVKEWKMDTLDSLKVEIRFYEWLKEHLSQAILKKDEEESKK